MADRRVGLWLIGACGGVGSTTALGLAAMAKGLTPPVGLATALPQFADLGFDAAAAFVVGGHDIRQSSFVRSVAELHSRANVFADPLLTACRETLEAWGDNIRPGVLYQANSTLAALADRPDVRIAVKPKAAIAIIRADLEAFKSANKLDQVVVVNVASTEPSFPSSPYHDSAMGFQDMLDRGDVGLVPTSTLYSLAAIEAGMPYLNGTPSLGASFPAAEALARSQKVPLAGQDFKTGETLMKAVLAPMFARRNLKVLSWVGHNILGNRDGQVLNDPANKSSKIKSKDALIAAILGYKPQTHVSIEYVESLDDWKTAWDHIHYEGFLGTKMTLQFTWQGCDSVLAAPLLLDVARILLRAQRNGETGSISDLAVFFKSPMGGVTEHQFAEQFMMLERYLLGSQSTP